MNIFVKVWMDCGNWGLEYTKFGSFLSYRANICTKGAVCGSLRDMIKLEKHRIYTFLLKCLIDLCIRFLQHPKLPPIDF